MPSKTPPPDIEAQIERYREAIRELREGRFQIDLPEPETGTIGRLGTELSALAVSLDRQFRESTQLQSLAEQVGEGVFLADVLRNVFEGFHGLIPFHRIGCALIDREQKTVVARWARSDAEQLEIYAGYSQPLAGSSLQQILDTGLPRIINDLEEHLEQHPDSDSTRRIVAEGVRSSLTCPLIAHGLPVGFLFFSSNEKNTYREVHPELFQKISRQLSMMIEKSMLYEELFTLNQKLLAAQRDLEHQARHDQMTGLPNRRALRERLDAEIARAARHGVPVGILLIDVDRFKQVNDTLGHQAGDEVLKRLAELLQANMRTFESIGRWGGEEFLAILDQADERAVIAVGERLRQAVARTRIPAGDGTLEITISVGAAAGVPDHPAWSDILVHAADTALYEAKSKGRNRVAFHST